MPLFSVRMARICYDVNETVVKHPATVGRMYVSPILALCLLRKTDQNSRA